MKATKTNGAKQYSLVWHRFLIYFFIPLCVGIMGVFAFASLIMFFICGLYDTIKLPDLLNMWSAQCVDAGLVFMEPLFDIIESLLTSVFSLTGGVAPAMHIRHLTICYLSIGIIALALMTRNSLAYFERNAVTLLNSLFMAIGGYIIVFAWLFQYVLTNLVSLKPRVFTDISFLGFRPFAYIKGYYQLFTSSFFKDNLFTGELFGRPLVPSVDFPDGQNVFEVIEGIYKDLSGSEVGLAIGVVVSVLLVCGFFVLVSSIYYKKRKSLFEFSC